MELTTEARINRLLDQLENPNLQQIDIDKLRDKIAFLKALEDDEQ